MSPPWEPRGGGGGGGGGGGSTHRGFLIHGAAAFGPTTDFPDTLGTAPWTQLGVNSSAVLAYGAPDWEIVSTDPGDFLGVRYLGPGGAFAIETAWNFSDSNFRAIGSDVGPSVFVWVGKSTDAPSGDVAASPIGRNVMPAGFVSGSDLLGAYYLPSPTAQNIVELATNDVIEVWARPRLGGGAQNPRVNTSQGFDFRWLAIPEGP